MFEARKKAKAEASFIMLRQTTHRRYYGKKRYYKKHHHSKHRHNKQIENMNCCQGRLWWITEKIK